MTSSGALPTDLEDAEGRRLARLKQALFPRRRLGDGRLYVTVIRATHVAIPAVCFSPPQVVVALGSQERRSPLGQAHGRHPIFDWRTELPCSGFESHLVFQVISGTQLLGSCALPLSAVLGSEGSFRRALPLLRNGKWIREGNNDGSELFVVVSWSANNDEGVPAIQQARAKALQLRCAQLRLTMRCLRLVSGLALDVNGINTVLPSVHAFFGPQKARTATAFRLARQDEVHKFVITGRPRDGFDCGDLTRGALDKYQAAPMPSYRRSTPQQGYCMHSDGNELRVTYLDVQWTFWYQNQETLQFFVIDDLFMSYPDPVIASGELDINQASLMAFTEDGTLLDDDGRQPSVFMRIPLTASMAQAPRPGEDGVAEAGASDGSTGGSSGSSVVVGHLELDVEFLEEPLASPSLLESTFRRVVSAKKELEEFNVACMKLIAEVMEAGGEFSSSTATGLPVIENLFDDQRRALAILCCSCSVAGSRRLAEYEAQSASLHGGRLATVIERICDMLLFEDDEGLREELVESGSSAVPHLPLDEAARAYHDTCRPSRSEYRLDRLLPLGSMLRQHHRNAWGGATLRTALRKAADELLPAGARGRAFFELLERHLVTSGQIEIAQAPELLADGCFSYAQVAAEARELAESEGSGSTWERQEQVRLARRQASSFLPEIDPDRLLKSDPAEADLKLLPGSLWWIIPSTALGAAILASLASLSYTQTAVLIHTFDDQVACDPAYKRYPGMLKVCKVMTRTHADEVLAWVASSPLCYRAIFLLFFAVDGKAIYDRLCMRSTVVREISLEPLSPPLSPLRVICVSGFLRNLADIFQPWQVNPDAPWTAGQVFVVRFDVDILHRLGLILSEYLVRQVKKSTVPVVKAVMALTNPITLADTIVQYILQELGDLMDIVCERASQVGRMLANQLLESAEQAEVRGMAQPAVNLIGFSTGAVLVFSCLLELRKLADQGRSFASDIVCDVVLLGAPVQASTEEWTKLRQLVSGRFVNGYARDDVLQWHQFRHGGVNFIGSHQLLAPDVENIPMGPFITAHSEYPMQMPLILDHIFRGRF